MVIPTKQLEDPLVVADRKLSLAFVIPEDEVKSIQEVGPANHEPLRRHVIRIRFVVAADAIDFDGNQIYVFRRVSIGIGELDLVRPPE